MTDGQSATITGQLPLRVGFNAGPAGAFPKEKLPINPLKISQAASLADLAQDMGFYTPALMYLKIRLFGREPHYNFMEESKINEIPLAVTFDKAVFSGLGDWNNVLWAYPKDTFKRLMDWYQLLAFQDREHKVVSWIVPQEIRIVDPLWLAKQVTIPSTVQGVTVHYLGVDSNVGQCALVREPLQSHWGVPKLYCTNEPHQPTKELAEAILNQMKDPYSTIVHQ